MKKKVTRRRFLRTGLKGSVAVGSAAVTGFGTALSREKRLDGIHPANEAPSSAFAPHEKVLLRLAMDEIIPPNDGMPAASAVGGVEYLDRLAGTDLNIKKSLVDSLAAVAKLSRTMVNGDFVSLTGSERVRVLSELEKQEPSRFAVLRDHVYEAYYTQPQVWKLIGYEFYPTNQAGPHMKPFDEAALAEVRKKPKFYREVP